MLSENNYADGSLKGSSSYSDLGVLFWTAVRSTERRRLMTSVDDHIIHVLRRYFTSELPSLGINIVEAEFIRGLCCS